ncbi:hypothetical protein RUM43_005451 [Polyplax serrata]|uniref:Uncharacterized protein n=1 Tax=Polyplax serrata TaxID=468196 RepID=A0AAN8PB86_POLSC
MCSSKRVACLLSVGALLLAVEAVNHSDKQATIEITQLHIIQPPVRCPEGTKADANGKCRKVWALNNTPRPDCTTAKDGTDCGSQPFKLPEIDKGIKEIIRKIEEIRRVSRKKGIKVETNTEKSTAA